ncbi:MAG: HD domain-containing protein [Gammaproteobacteria bacterium]|nr:HD domain-containing protein [Gammaproteobacteria bacterium]
MTTVPLKILLVDDDNDTVLLIHRLLSEMKGWNCKPEWVNTFARGSEVMNERRHDIYLFDHTLPDGSGTELIREGLAKNNPAPMIMITDKENEMIIKDALEAGAADVLDKNELNGTLLERVIRYTMERFDRLHTLIRIKEDSKQQLQEQEEFFALEKKRLKRELAETKHSEKQLEHQLVKAMQLVSRAVESRVPDSSGHQQRIAQFASAIAAKMGRDQKFVDRVYLAGLVHDLGNIDIPTELLWRPGKLTPVEYNIVRTHSKLGHDMLQELEFAAPLADIVKQHHERMDGSGYPAHLRGNEILIEARIVAVAEAVGSMLSDRPHREAYTTHGALIELMRNRDTLFDPEVVDACVLVCEERFGS